jgi:hypothetical protein
MRHTATPGEIERWESELSTLPPDRSGSVIKMLTEVAGDCPGCEEAVRRCDPRTLVDGRLAHLDCARRPI